MEELNGMNQNLQNIHDRGFDRREGGGLPVGNCAGGPVSPAGAAVLRDVLVPHSTDITLPVDVAPVQLLRVCLGVVGHFPGAFVGLHFSHQVGVSVLFVSAIEMAQRNLIKGAQKKQTQYTLRWHFETLLSSLSEAKPSESMVGSTSNVES